MMFSALVLSVGLLPVVPQPVECLAGDETYELRIAADGSAEIRAGARGRIWAEVTYAQLKKSAKSDADFHDIEMESLNLPALERNAEVERTIAAENGNVAELAAFCSAFKRCFHGPRDT